MRAYPSLTDTDLKAQIGMRAMPDRSCPPVRAPVTTTCRDIAADSDLVSAVDALFPEKLDFTASPSRCTIKTPRVQAPLMITRLQSRATLAPRACGEHDTVTPQTRMRT